MGHLPEGRGILGLLINDPRPVRLSDLSKHPASIGFPPNHPPMKSFLGTPIMIRGKVFGSIYLTEKLGEPEFTEEDAVILKVLATSAAMAVDNARLFEGSRTRERWLAAMARSTRAYSWAARSTKPSVYSPARSANLPVVPELSSSSWTDRTVRFALRHRPHPQPTRCAST